MRPYLFLITLLLPIFGFGQNNCSNTFYTVTVGGVIQSWNLDGQVISGGDVELVGAATDIAYCTLNGEETFFGTNYPLPGISFYNLLPQNWENLSIPSQDVFINTGGFAEHLYAMSVLVEQFPLPQTLNKAVCYINGSSIDTLMNFDTNGNYCSVADIAVDTLGQAWVFTGTTSATSTKLRVFNPTGQVMEFSMNEQTTNAYGSFFLNGTLYVCFGATAQTPNTIAPVVLDGSNAYFGNGIPFPGVFTDAASCQVTNEIVTHVPAPSNNDLLCYPNPVSSALTIQAPNSDLNTTRTSLYDMTGRLVYQEAYNSTMDVSSLDTGSYIVVVETEKGRFRGTIQKL